MSLSHPVIAMSSRQVTSNQQGPHEDLVECVHKHLRTTWQRPVPAHTQQAFDVLLQHHQLSGHAPLVLDSGCGVGQSTLKLAQKHPNALVVGVDKSEARLERSPPRMPDNSLLLRADAASLWQLMAQAKLTLSHHYLLYPNPWPRKQHMLRRWHGHPAFGLLQSLGGEIELRTNWPIYAQEFAIALGIIDGGQYEVATFVPDDPISPFEAKYQSSGHSLYQVKANLGT